MINIRSEIDKKRSLIKYYFFLDPFDACLEEQEKGKNFVLKIENVEISKLESKTNLKLPNNEFVKNVSDKILPLPKSTQVEEDEINKLSYETKNKVDLIKENTKLANVLSL